MIVIVSSSTIIPSGQGRDLRLFKDFDPDPPFFPFGAFGVLDSFDFDDLDLEDDGSGNGNDNDNDNGNVNELFYLLWLGLYALPLLDLSLVAVFAVLEDLDDLSDFDLEDMIGTFDPFASFKPLMFASFFSAKHVAKKVRDTIIIELWINFIV